MKQFILLHIVKEEGETSPVLINIAQIMSVERIANSTSTFIWGPISSKRNRRVYFEVSETFAEVVQQLGFEL
ncbi:MAG: hypothetical protein RR086_03590 [Clostridia bacterium]